MMVSGVVCQLHGCSGFLLPSRALLWSCNKCQSQVKMVMMVIVVMMIKVVMVMLTMMMVLHQCQSQMNFYDYEEEKMMTAFHICRNHMIMVMMLTVITGAP